ncbi:hypothetical protein C447_13397 [Halococcus hamelinensis 100A6]|uniref:Uncharacterized protein n=2 Tax=Halococcus hamelinensis TaxID=332168 RepID=M0LYM4_9EURY|nr:hypothetical protein C447_13397 [Halococcus hamelinensis 100A6]
MAGDEASEGVPQRATGINAVWGMIFATSICVFLLLWLTTESVLLSAIASFTAICGFQTIILIHES